jgi:glycosyltransferase involved in cell wall biosynthesis
MPKVSVIIPVYNTEPYLRRCLDSVIGQTLREIEIICVNDGSTDDSPAILRKTAAMDERVVRIDFSRNEGVSAARNAGIAIARGQYLGFVDSDDVLDLHFYESLYAKAVASSPHIVRGTLRWVGENGKEWMFFHNAAIRKDQFEFNMSFCTAIYHTIFIRDNGISFPLGVVNGEDMAFYAKSVSLALHVETVNNATYHYLRRENSARTNVFNIKQLQSVITACEDVISFLNSHSHAIDKNDYAKLCSRHILISLRLFARAVPESKAEVADLYANAACRLYAMCSHQDAVAEHLTANSRILGSLIIAGNVTMLVNFLNKDMTLRQLVFAELRSRAASNN